MPYIRTFSSLFRVRHSLGGVFSYSLQRYMLSLNDLVITFIFVGERHMKEDVIFNKVSRELLDEVLYMMRASRKKHENVKSWS